MFVAVIAALAMLVQDVLGTIMVQAEAASLNFAPLPLKRQFGSTPQWILAIGKALLDWHRWIAAFMDALGWGVAITTTTISVLAFSGHDTHEKILVAVLVTLANLIGTTCGQEIGKLVLHKRGALTHAERLVKLEETVTHLHERDCKKA